MDDFVFGYGSLCFKAIPIAELSSVLFDPVDLISRAGYIKVKQKEEFGIHLLLPSSMGTADMRPDDAAVNVGPCSKICAGES